MRAVRFHWALAVVLLACEVRAQFPTPRLDTIFPPGAQAGSSVTVKATGENLDGLKELRFTHTGIRGRVTSNNMFEVTIATNVPPGRYEARALGVNGISNPRRFVVGTMPEQVSETPAASAETPTKLTLNSTVNARAESAAIHHFEVAAAAGQHIVVRCEAEELDSKFEPVFAALDAAGREVVRARHGGVLDFQAPADGSFTIKLHDATYRGGAEFAYRLSAGTFAHVDGVFPPVVRPGTNALALVGRNLPARSETTVALPPEFLKQLPIASATADVFAHAFDVNGSHAAVPLLATTQTNIVSEGEPNDTPAQAQRIAPPCELAGRFGAADRDWFTFEARKGDVLWFEITSHRLGLPTDPIVVVQHVTTNGATDVLELNDSAANIGGAEFNTAHRDGAGRFEAKQEGTYRILIRNLFSRLRPDPRLVYVLSIRKPAPDFRLVALPQPAALANKDAKAVPVSSTSARRGQTVPVKVLAIRRDGFDGEIALSVADAPPGLAVAPARIESGKSSALLFVTAVDDAPGTCAPLRVQGAAAMGGTNVVREAQAATVAWGTPDPANEAVISRFAASLEVACVEETFPVRVRANEQKTWETASGEKLKIDLTIMRDENHSAAMKLKPVGHPALDSAKELDVPANATNAVLELDLAQQKLPQGMHTFALAGSVASKPPKDKGKKKETTLGFYSAPILVRVSAATNTPAK